MSFHFPGFIRGTRPAELHSQNANPVRVRGASGARKKPMGLVQDLIARRRARPPKASRPLPSKSMLAGSGVAVSGVLSPANPVGPFALAMCPAKKVLPLVSLVLATSKSARVRLVPLTSKLNVQPAPGDPPVTTQSPPLDPPFLPVSNT